MRPAAASPAASRLTRAEVIERLIAAELTASPREQRALAENVLRRSFATTVGLLVGSERSVTLVHEVLLSHWPRLRAWQAPDWRPPPEPAPAAARARDRAGKLRAPVPVRQTPPATTARVDGGPRRTGVRAPGPERDDGGPRCTGDARVSSSERTPAERLFRARAAGRHGDGESVARGQTPPPGPGAGRAAGSPAAVPPARAYSATTSATAAQRSTPTTQRR